MIQTTFISYYYNFFNNCRLNTLSKLRKEEFIIHVQTASRHFYICTRKQTAKTNSLTFSYLALTVQVFVRRKIKTVFVCNNSSTVCQPDFFCRAIDMHLNGLVKHLNVKMSKIRSNRKV